MKRNRKKGSKWDGFLNELKAECSNVTKHAATAKRKRDSDVEWNGFLDTLSAARANAKRRAATPAHKRLIAERLAR